MPKLRCGHCKKEQETSQFKTCGRCGRVRYCSKECQRTHWKAVHKKHCCKEVQEKTFAQWFAPTIDGSDQLSAADMTVTLLLQAYSSVSESAPGGAEAHYARVCAHGYDWYESRLTGDLADWGLHYLQASQRK